MAQTAIDYIQNMLRTCWQRTTYLVAQTTKRWQGQYKPLSSHDLDAKSRIDSEAKPRYRLDDETSDTMTLPDGRKLGYAIFGASTGPTIFHLHGFPGSRSQGAVYEEIARRLGARVIAVDRPGAGLSSAQPGRTPLDHAHDITHLAKQLHIERFAVMGVSGGGLYALACATAIPKENLKGVALVAGIGPWELGFKGMKHQNRLLFYGFRYWPSAVRWVLLRLRTATAKVPEDVLLEGMQWKPQYAWLRFFGPPAKDAEILQDRDHNKLMLKASREFGALGVDSSYMEEGRIYTSDSGYKIEDIDPELPIQLWYGKQDVNVPLRMGQEIAVRLGGRATMKVEDETHVSLIMNFRSQVLDGLLKCL